MSTGYPTPDNEEGELQFDCIEVVIPSNPEFQGIFAAAVYGLYAQMTNSWFWRELGTMSPDRAAEIASLGLGQTEAYENCMDCDGVADCIENNEAVQSALAANFTQNLSSNGISPNDGATLPSVTVSSDKQSENLMPASAACTAPENMAIARAIIVEFDRSVTDFLETIELLTDPAEIVAELGDNVEGVSWLDSVPEIAVWLQDTFADIYTASYTHSVETSLACGIFCVLQDDCELSLNDLIGVMQDAMGSIEPPPSLDDYQALFDWIINIDTSVGSAVVAAYYYLGLQAMRFAAGILPGFTVFADIKQVINGAIGKFDSTYDQCDDCPPSETPTSFWMIYQDFREGLNGWTIQLGTEQSDGVLTGNNGGTSRANVRYNDLGGAYALRAGAIRSQRRGSDGNGTSDTNRLSGFQNTNCAGTERTINTLAFVTCNTNNCYAGTVLGSNTATCQSLQAQINVTGAPVVPTNFGRIVEVVVYGIPNGTTKPDNAVWVSSIPDASDLFPT